jgi:hypothetical protein
MEDPERLQWIVSSADYWSQIHITLMRSKIRFSMKVRIRIRMRIKSKKRYYGAVLRIHEILVRIRIHKSIPVTNGSGSGCESGSCFFRQ